jgi:hypothetical protein
MAYELVRRPIPGYDAFEQSSDAGILSQAAFLLILGNQLRGTPQARAARAAAAGIDAAPEILPPDDAEVFPVPAVPATAERFHPEKLRPAAERAAGGEAMRERYRRAPTQAEANRLAYSALAKGVYETPTPDAAAALLNECLFHDHELIRTCAAAAYFSNAADPALLIGILAKATSSKDALTRSVAATALARFAPGDARLEALMRPRRLRTRRRPSRTSLMVHGTWARGQSWWQPGGDFHTYVRSEVRPDLYSASDRFEWSGGYSEAARAEAGIALSAWIVDPQRNLNGLDVFAHSHGGSVAMLATQALASVGQLVLLSCPAHEDQYLPDFNHVQKVVSIRVHADLVIFADGGGQRFRDPRMAQNEHVLSCWFDHSLTHDAETWRQFDVPSML